MSGIILTESEQNGQKMPQDRHKVVQFSGTKEHKEQKRSAELAQTLPRGIRISRWTDDRPKPFFVRYGNPRKTESYATEKERNDRAAELMQAAQEHGSKVMRFDPAEWDAFQRWRSEQASRPASKTCEEAVAAFLEARESADLAEDSIRHTKTNLGRFAAFGGPASIDVITAEDVQRWLDELKAKHGFSPATLRHHRKDLNVFFKWCVKREWAKRNPCEAVELPKVRVSDEVAVLSLADAFRLFQANRNEVCVGRLALECFAGLRHASVKRITAAELHWPESAIELPGAKHKSGRRHYLDGWPRNLWAWLKHASPECWEMGGRNYGAHKAMAFARANVKNPGNVCRHSFATHHLAAFRDGAAIARLMQHRNLSMMYSHYLGRGVSQRIALAYFKITPRTVLLSFDRFSRLCGIPTPANTPTK